MPDVAAKRQDGLRTAVVWGCELQGDRGRAGGPRTRRAALAALTLALCLARVATPELLGRVLGLWTDLLLYRRAAYAVLSAAYQFLHRYRDEPHTARTLTGPVISELLGLVCLAPLLDSPLRAPVDRNVKASDASPSGAAVVAVTVPQEAADELWRQRVRPGGRTNCAVIGAPGNTRGDSATGELLESLPAREMLRFAFGNKRPPHINVGEMRSRRALWRTLAQDPRAHCRRHLVAYDSSATVGASNKGRSPKTGMLREARLTYPYLFAADCTEGTLWTDSERMPADGPSRRGHVQFPAPQREWVAAFLDGDQDALARRFGPTQLPADFDTEDHDPTLGVRIGEAKKPGPRVPRYDVDLRERVFGGLSLIHI